MPGGGRPQLGSLSDVELYRIANSGKECVFAF
jgi:hypothetical protein